MEQVGWVGVAVLGAGGFFTVVKFVLDQIPDVAKKAGDAVDSVRELRAKLKQEPGAAIDDDDPAVSER